MEQRYSMVGCAPFTSKNIRTFHIDHERQEVRETGCGAREGVFSGAAYDFALCFPTWGAFSTQYNLED